MSCLSSLYTGIERIYMCVYAILCLYLIMFRTMCFCFHNTFVEHTIHIPYLYTCTSTYTLCYALYTATYSWVL